MPGYRSSLLDDGPGTISRPSLLTPDLTGSNLTTFPMPTDPKVDTGGPGGYVPGGPIVDRPWEHNDIFDLIDGPEYDPWLRRSVDKSNPLEQEKVPPLNAITQISPEFFLGAPEEVRKPVSILSTVDLPEQPEEKMPEVSPTLSTIDFEDSPEVVPPGGVPGEGDLFITTTGGVTPDQDRNRDLSGEDFDVRPSNELEDLIGGEYTKLLRGENPAHEQNQRAAMTYLARNKREIDAEVARQAARMGIAPGSEKYAELRNRLMEGHLSSGSDVMSSLASKNLEATQAALGQAGQFLGQQQSYGMDYGKFTYQRMRDDRDYAENVRRWDADWEENNRRYGQERADELAAQKISQLMKTMTYVNYLSPGQFGEIKGELGELLGADPTAWAAPEPRQIEYLRDQLMERGYTKEEAEAELNKAKQEGLLSMFGPMGDMLNAEKSDLGLPVDTNVSNSGGSNQPVFSSEIMDLIDQLQTGGGYRSGKYGSLYGQGGAGIL